jgi:hypothetical protein
VIGAALEPLESRRLLSAGDLTAVATFDGTDGEAPAAVVGDSAGDLFGVTYLSITKSGGTGNGVVFEIAAGSSTITDLATLPSQSGGALNEGESLIIDSSGNLYGTDSNAIFELAKGSKTLQTLSTFPSIQEAGNVTAIDSSGNLWGLSQGNVFELPKGSSTITYNVFGDEDYLQSLELGPDGNFYGTTANTIVEDSTQTGMATTLATFNSSTTGNTPTGLTFDADGNIWGFCSYGGPNGSAPGNGDIWELPVGSNTIINQASFTSTTGFVPLTSPVIDSSGNLYGLTEQGGTNDDGTFFSFPTQDVSTSAVAGRVAPDTVTATISPQANLTGGDSPSSGTTMGRGDPAYKSTPTGPTASEETGETPYSPDGAILKPATSPPPERKLTDADWKKFKDDWEKLKQRFQQIQDLYNGLGPAPLPSPLAVRFAVVSDAASRSSELATINHLLSDIQSDLTACVNEITVGIDTLDSYTTLGQDITSLDSSLATQTNETKREQIKKEIEADEATQDSDATADNTYYDKADKDIKNIESLQTETQDDLDAVPAAEVTFTGSIRSVQSPATKGQKATAEVVIDNLGNVTAVGALTLQLSARPLGTTGSADISLPAVSVTIDLAADGSVKENLEFTVPKSLADGHYYLVMAIDPDKLYGESTAPTPVVGSELFRVN